jgi:hypothetical protein
MRRVAGTNDTSGQIGCPRRSRGQGPGRPTRYSGGAAQSTSGPEGASKPSPRDRIYDGILAALKRVFNLGLQQSPPKMPQKPYIPTLRERNIREGFFEHDECIALRAALPLELRPMVTFGYYTRWRKEEVLT